MIAVNAAGQPILLLLAYSRAAGNRHHSPPHRVDADHQSEASRGDPGTSVAPREMALTTYRTRSRAPLTANRITPTTSS